MVTSFTLIAIEVLLAVSVAVAVCEQPPAVVTVTVYVPAHKPDAVAPVPPDGAQLYV